MELGIGLPRAVAQGFSCSCKKFKLLSNCRRNSKSCGVKLNWGLDGFARWRDVTITVTIELTWGVIFKGI